MQAYQIRLPQQFNDGRTVPQDIHELARDVALRQFGGFTDGSVTNGSWHNPADGQTYVEPMQDFYVAADSESDVLEYARYLCLLYSQESIYVARIATAVWFVSVD